MEKIVSTAATKNNACHPLKNQLLVLPKTEDTVCLRHLDKFIRLEYLKSADLELYFICI